MSGDTEIGSTTRTGFRFFYRGVRACLVYRCPCFVQIPDTAQLRHGDGHFDSVTVSIAAETNGRFR